MKKKKKNTYSLNRKKNAPWKQWGTGLEPEAIKQMENGCSLPVSFAGALMPDAHVGYGLPIGGVLATQNSVIPYAVGMDIACRMKMTVMDIPPSALTEKKDWLIHAIEKETMFGVGSHFSPMNRRQHNVMDEDWSISKISAHLKDKAWSQLGTSGAGNHFVEFGILTLDKKEIGLEPGRYVALLSHSGSRGTGGQVATYYSKVAAKKHPGLQKELIHLAWLDLDSHEGQEYWKVMELMGHYAAANHKLIHDNITRRLGVEVLTDIENHHNFAWKENHFGKDLIVHRKGAIPAGTDILGIIPGSMATSAYVVRGKGSKESLNSAAHGAGRQLSRKAAKKKYTAQDLSEVLDAKGVILISAGLDEVPMAYKDIEKVMREQADLVEPVARFDPKIVKMARSEKRRY